MRRFRTFAVIAICAGVSGQAGAASEQMARLPDGRRIFMRCEGAGSPTVVLESGYLASSGVWSKVQPEIAGRARVCAYDRSGFGKSEPGPLPRDGAATARDLSQALDAAGEKGPFVLVGHSAGGLYVRLLADLRPRDVVGMVLVDPSGEHQDRRFAEAFGPGASDSSPLHRRAARCLAAAEAGQLPSNDPSLTACAPPPRPGEAAPSAEAVSARWRSALSEVDALWTSTSDEVDRGRRSYGDMPLIVLTAEGTYAAAAPAARTTADAVWRQMHREMAARSSRGEERVVAGSGHMIMLEKPEAVVQAVDEVVAAARSKSRTAGD
jgi:pimeloyl-ACP methyl ester carboxylesterase